MNFKDARTMNQLNTDIYKRTKCPLCRKTLKTYSKWKDHLNRVYHYQCYKIIRERKENEIHAMYIASLLNDMEPFDDNDLDELEPPDGWYGNGKNTKK